VPIANSGSAEMAREDCRLAPQDASCATGNYTAIQRLVLRQDAICREIFERAIATAFARFAREVCRFNQPV